MKNKIPDGVISEIFRKRLTESKLSEEVYDQLKKMILSGKFTKWPKIS